MYLVGRVGASSGSLSRACALAPRAKHRPKPMLVPRVLRLVAIPISHYCEKARWVLERAGLAYREEPHVEGLRRIAARLAGGGRTVPVLVTPEVPGSTSARLPSSASFPLTRTSASSSSGRGRSRRACRSTSYGRSRGPRT